MLFLLPFYEDERFGNNLYIKDDKVDLLWVVPITGQEFEQCQQDKCARRVVENLMQIENPRLFDIIS